MGQLQSTKQGAVPKTATPIATTATASVQEWMKAQALDQYSPKLIDTLGYDDLDVLRSLNKTELERIASLCSMLPGHTAKFVWGLQQQVPTTPESKTPLPPAATKDATKDASYVAMVVDRSGSMTSMGNEVMNGFNKFLEQQQAQSGECNATVVRFDTEIETLHHGVPIADVPMATNQTFKPRGGTALVDAMGQTIQMVETKIASMTKRPGRIMVMILTDGQDNQSHRFKRGDVMATIKRLEDTGDWQFVFVGANQDAISVGAQYGMQMQNCLSFDADRSHGQKTWEALNANVTQYRQCASKSSYGGFSDLQRSACKSSGY